MITSIIRVLWMLHSGMVCGGIIKPAADWSNLLSGCCLH